MPSRVIGIALITLLTAVSIRPAAAQTDWRLTLGVLYTISYSINACGLKVTPEHLRKLERTIAHAEGKVNTSRTELHDLRRKGEVEARKDARRMCETMGRDALRLIDELPDRLSD